MLRQYPQLFEIEDHGANHVPAVIGTGRSVYGIAGNADASKLRDEVLGGAVAIEQAIGATPRWYRGATAKYDEAAIIDIERLGYRIAGFSLNADDGATLSRQAIVARLKAARGGDIIIAHMNKPASDTAEGLAIGLKWMLAEGIRFTNLGDMRVELVPTAAIIRARKKTS